jgi:hypothetical protein
LRDLNRKNLANLQRQLVHALLNGNGTPQGFNLGELQATRQVLLNKRRKALQANFPQLVMSLGERFDPLCWQYIKQTPHLPPSLDRPKFVAFIASRGELPEIGAREFLGTKFLAIVRDGAGATLLVRIGRRVFQFRSRRST